MSKLLYLKDFHLGRYSSERDPRTAFLCSALNISYICEETEFHVVWHRNENLGNANPVCKVSFFDGKFQTWSSAGSRPWDVGGGGGARSSRPLDKGGGGGGLPKLFSGPSGLSLGSKNNGGDPPLDPLLLKKGFAPYRRPLGSWLLTVRIPRLSNPPSNLSPSWIIVILNCFWDLGDSHHRNDF